MKKFTLFLSLLSLAGIQNTSAQLLVKNLPETTETLLPIQKIEREDISITPKWEFIRKKSDLPDYVPGEVYVKFKENALEYKNMIVDKNGQVSFRSLSFLTAIFEKYQVEEFYNSFNGADSPYLQSSFRMKIGDDSKVEQLIKELSAKQFIELVVKVPLFKIFLMPDDPYYNLTSSGGYNINWNWHLDKINAEAAWDISTGSSTVKVAIVDNAVYTNHPDLSAKIVYQKDIADNDNNANPPASVTDPDDEYTWSHGTHGAGLAGAISNNGVGIASIGYGVSLMAIKCTKNNANPLAISTGYEGIQHAADNGAHVINMSFGGPLSGSSEINYAQNIVNYAYNKGCVLVAAAGNSGTETASYPANLNNVIAVGSTNYNDKKSSFSQYGSWVNVMAPGGFINYGGTAEAINILSTTYNTCYALKQILGVTTVAFMSERYDGMQGTSMASPIVAGLAGLIKSAKPTLTATQIADCIINTADNINAANPTYVGKLGSGRINAKAALECAVGITTNPEEPENPENPNAACDTVNLSKVRNETWTPSVYSYSTGNYMLGVNQYNDKEVFQYFDLSNNSAASGISGAVVGLSPLTIVGSNKSIKISIYNSTAGAPGTLIGSTTFQAQSMAQSGYIIFNFTSPIAIPTGKKFFVGFDFSSLSYAAGDRLGVISNQQGETTPSNVFIRESNNSISNIDATLTDNLNVSAFIFPILSGCSNSNSTGIEENNASSWITSYFAPNSKEVVVEFHLPTSQNFTYRLVNALGQIIYNGTMHVQEGKSSYRVDANMISSGMYVLQILNQQTQYANKLMIQ